jgi:IclR family acetate operon transcriptional repressor
VTPVPPDPARATGAQAIERSLAVLSAFIQARPELGVAEVARAVGLSPSTAHRILRALVAGGYLAQSEATNRYYLGRSALLLGQVAQSNLGLDHAHSILEQLGEQSGESLNLGVRDGDAMVVALRVSSPHALRFDQPPGTRVALDCSAMGKAVLAFGPDPEAELARLAPLEPRTAHTRTDLRDALAELEATLERGWSVDDQESVVGVRCIGAPVLDSGRRPRAAIALQAPAARMPFSRIEALAPSVVAAAADIADAMPSSRALESTPGRAGPRLAA